MEISCLSVFSLGYDATERDLHILFSGCNGYVRSVVVQGKTAVQRPYAFVQFGTPQEAVSAMHSRAGTTWSSDLPPISLEMAKRNIPDNFVTRHAEPAPPHIPTPPVASNVVSIVPPPKRHRTDAIGGRPNLLQPQDTGSGLTWGSNGLGAQVWGGNDYAANVASPADADDNRPRTLHIGGLPPTLVREDLEIFLQSTFGDAVVGFNLSDKTRGNSEGRAFIGFRNHTSAQEALALLDGYDWFGHALRPEFARSEFRLPGGMPNSVPVQPSPHVVAPKMHTPYAPPTSQLLYRPIGAKVNEIGAGAQAWQISPSLGPAKIGQDAGGWNSTKKTLHFTNLPHMTQDSFDQFLSTTFPSMTVAFHLKDSNDGRPPVAWVLFADEGTASETVKQYSSFELEGVNVSVQYARTELDPNKFRRT